MEEKLLDIDFRKKVITEIKGDENTQRKIVAYKKKNMQNDNFYQYVKEHLEYKLDPQTVSELEIFSEINLQKRISKAEAGVYKKQPERSFFIGNKEIEEYHDIYQDMDVDTVLKRSNEAYKYQDQCVIQIYPEDQKLSGRVLEPHHYDVLTDEKNPEKPYCYIISNFDNTSRDKIRREPNKTGFSQGDRYRDQVNQEIADYDDAILEKERFYFWSKSYNFVTDGHGRILDKQTEEPLTEFDDIDINIISPLADYQCIPFIDISKPKDFEYWCRGGDALYDATLRYNVILTSEFQVVEMQGHAQPYYKGDAEHMPENVRIGVDKMIHIPVNPNNPVNAEFGFANPNSDLAGVREFRESFLKTFLSSRGLDVSIVNGSGEMNKASSGVEKLLQMIEKFEASQEDFSLYKKVEQELIKIVSCFIASFRGERIDGELVLNEKYQLNIPNPKDVKVEIEYAKPEMIKTEMEILEVAEKEIDMGISSKVHYLMDHKGMTKEQAIQRIKEIEQYETLGMINNGIEAIETDTERDQTDIQS